MKRTITLCLIFCALLCGCQKETGNADNQTDMTVKDEQNTQTNQNSTGGGDGDQTRLAYYEQLVNELQQQVLNLKTEIYANRVEYESRIDELEAGRTPEGDSPSNSAPPTQNQGASAATSFRYTVENGAVTLTSYIGTGKTVEIPTTIDGCPVVAIGDRAFLDHAALTSVTIPEGVTHIGWFAFSGCVSLKSVTMPASVSSINYGAFENCDSKMTVVCHAGSYAEAYANSYGMIVQKQ